MTTDRTLPPEETPKKNRRRCLVYEPYWMRKEIDGLIAEGRYQRSYVEGIVLKELGATIDHMKGKIRRACANGHFRDEDEAPARKPLITWGELGDGPPEKR